MSCLIPPGNKIAMPFSVVEIPFYILIMLIVIGLPFLGIWLNSRKEKEVGENEEIFI
jgi:hypothetical protein